VLYALNGSRGNLLWDINLRTDYGDSSYSLQQGPIISDFRNDDTLDVFVAGGYANYPNIQTDFGRAYAIKSEKVLDRLGRCSSTITGEAIACVILHQQELNLSKQIR